jgi:beta-lactamase regulating signal transducer with metallopeptidase domain
MKLGRTLWLVVIVKLFIMFAILKVFFFPNFLNSKFESEREKADYVNSELIERSTSKSATTLNLTDSVSN